MPELTEGNHAGEHIMQDWQNLSRENVTVKSGQNLKAGHVVALETASGKIVEYDNAGADGTEVAYGVLYDNVDATNADMPGVITRRMTVLKLDALSWFGAVDQTAIDAALVDLEAQMVVAR